MVLVLSLFHAAQWIHEMETRIQKTIVCVDPPPRCGVNRKTILYTNEECELCTRTFISENPRGLEMSLKFIRVSKKINRQAESESQDMGWFAPPWSDLGGGGGRVSFRQRSREIGPMCTRTGRIKHASLDNILSSCWYFDAKELKGNRWNPTRSLKVSSIRQCKQRCFAKTHTPTRTNTNTHRH